VFNESQILPCYVLHLMLRDKKREAATATTLRMEQRCHGLAQNRSRILTAMARKNLPFGFGPRGEHFVVEEIAEHSEDEEDWGEFQLLRDGTGVGYEEYQPQTVAARSVLPPPRKD
jgi:hypothetical protein